MLNMKIESPDDNNYSDDELAFLPYYTYLTMVAPNTASHKAVRASIDRSWLYVRGLRSALWNTIYIATNGTDYEQSDVDSIGWNLRTWPLELVSWPVMNSQRRDLAFSLEPDRSGNVGDDSVRIKGDGQGRGCRASVLLCRSRSYFFPRVPPLRPHPHRSLASPSAFAFCPPTSARSRAGTPTRMTLTAATACPRATRARGWPRTGSPATTASSRRRAMIQWAPPLRLTRKKAARLKCVPCCVWQLVCSADSL